MDTTNAISVAKYISKSYGIDWREILGDVWLSINNGANRVYTVRMNLIDIYRKENRKRIIGRKVITSLEIDSASRTYRTEPSLLSIWNEYRGIRDRIKLNIKERVYLYLWSVEGWMFKEIAQFFKISPASVSLVTYSAQHKLGLN